MSKDPPLKIVGNIGGGIALPRIEKGRKIMKDRKGDWSNTEEIPVRCASHSFFDDILKLVHLSSLF
jgi:E3 ubiquitin-protein transferase RMND5